jgi:hypothetical protein
MQAQYCSKRKRSKEDRQYPAPPTGAKAGGLSISKEVVDFLLDHDVDLLDSCALLAKILIDASDEKMKSRKGITGVQRARLGWLRRRETGSQPGSAISPNG